MPESTPQNAFLDVLLAAMHDAVLEGKLTQFATQFQPEGTKGLKRVRIIVVPEEMQFKWPSHAPLGTPVKGN